MNTEKRSSGKGAIGYELLLVLITMLWGSTFVAQSVAMDDVGPVTFIFSRFLISGLVLLVVSLITGKVRDIRIRKWEEAIEKDPDALVTMPEIPDMKLTIKGGLLTGISLFLAATAQQMGLVYTTVGEGSFISTCYIVLVPIASGIFLKKKIPYPAWIAVAAALVGLFFISMEKGEGFSINVGNLYMMLAAMLFTWQILLADKYSKGTDLMWLACIEFLTIAVIAFPIALIFEKIRIESLLAAAGPILYAALVSGSFCYTMQFVAQKHLDSTLASLIMGGEAVFAALSGWLFLSEHLGFRKLFGCALVMAAVIIAQIPVKEKKLSK